MAAPPPRLRHQSSLSSLLKLSPRKPHHPAPAASTDENVSTEAPVGFVKGLLRRVSSSSHDRHEAKKRIKLADDDREPFKSYLRVRPPPAATDRSSCAPSCVEILGDTEVKLHAPDNPSTNGLLGLRAAPGALPASTFTFTRVFGPGTAQPDFFQSTALPLVQDVLNGTSGLLFAYGVSNSGKTYTVQGGPNTGDPGILPRAVDVVFNSIGDRHALAHVRPTKLDGVETIPVSERTPHFATYLNDVDITAGAGGRADTMAHDATRLTTSDDCTYAVWLSYIEVYNEKVYDLLEPSPTSSTATATPQMPGSFTAMSLATLAAADSIGGPTPSFRHHQSSSADVKRKALSLKHDKESGHRYVSGATEIRVWSAADARIVMRKGQINRRVHGTMMNRSSSRSHGIFTIKVIRVPAGDAATADLAASSRLSIVDLAGSERTRNAQTTGERLKEAGNINKSLMVLGQCLEVIRQNQQQREKGKKAQQVPFRHSKLTELFQSFFLGQGRAAMIVCLNPYETGFDESVHVMKFAAVAKDVTTSRPIAVDPFLVERPRTNPFRHPQAPEAPEPRETSPLTSGRPPLQALGIAGEPSLNTFEQRESTPAPDAFVLAPEHLSDDDEVEGEDEEDDGFVDYLLEEIGSLRVQLIESQIETAAIEARVRQEVVRDLSGQMRQMEDDFALRMQTTMDAAERKYDQKIAILQRAHADLLEAMRQEYEESYDDDEEDDREDSDEVEETVAVAAEERATGHGGPEMPELEERPAAQQAAIIDVDALSDSDEAQSPPATAPKASSTPAPTMPSEPPTSASVASPEPAIEEEPAAAAKRSRRSTRKSNRAAAAAAAAAAAKDDEGGTTPRKSRAKLGAVADRIKALEALMLSDEDESMVLDSGRSPPKRKRRLVTRSARPDDDNDDEEGDVLRASRSVRSGVARVAAARNLRTGRM